MPGNLFAVLNVMIGYLLLRLPVVPGPARWISRLGLVGMLMPIGILAEIVFGSPPLFVMIGGVSMVVAIAWLCLAVAQMRDMSDPVQAVSS